MMKEKYSREETKVIMQLFNDIVKMQRMQARVLGDILETQKQILEKMESSIGRLKE